MSRLALLATRRVLQVKSTIWANSGLLLQISGGPSSQKATVTTARQIGITESQTNPSFSPQLKYCTAESVETCETIRKALAMSPEDRNTSLQICRQKSGLTIITLPADLRAWTYGTRQQDYNEVMKQLGETAQPRLLFDMSNCVMLDSATVGILIALTKEAIRRNGSSCLAGVSGQIHQTLSKLMLLEPRHRQLRWNVYDSLESALANSDTLGDSDTLANSVPLGDSGQLGDCVREVTNTQFA